MPGAVLLVLIGLLAVPPVLAFLRSLIVIPLRLWLGQARPVPGVAEYDWPPVTVQLALYRESVVLERLLHSVLAIDYPRDRLRLQIVDDSEGTEAERCRAIVAGFEDQPVPIEYINRPDRSGFKAGALNAGMATIVDELIAFFDADFEARADVLKVLVPAFADAAVGGIQARWEYMNAGDSPVTQLQAGIFDKMFCFEFDVRSGLRRPGLFLGSNGIFRRSALQAIGGWREVPFTSEDLDVAYRIQAAGWKLLYDPRPLAWTELPESFLPYMQQQRRWARGMTRVFLDHWRSALFAHGRRRQPGTWPVEWLEGSLIVFQVFLPLVVLLPVLVLAYLLVGGERSAAWMTVQALLFFALVTPPVLLEIAIAQRLLYADWLQRLRRIAVAAPLALGLSVALLAGVWETLSSSRAEFVRTPKRGQLGIVRNNVHAWLRGFLPVLAAQWLLGAVCVVAGIVAVWRGAWEVLPLMISMGGGFLLSARQASWELRVKSRLAGPVVMETA